MHSDVASGHEPDFATIVCLVIYFHVRVSSSMCKCKKVKFMLYNNRQSVCIQT